MFNSRKDKIKMLQQISFTSKAALKQQSLYYANGNTKEARELYAFLIEDLQNLPDTDPAPPSWKDNTMSTVNGVMSWIQENQNTLAQGLDFIRGLFSKGKVVPPAGEPLPPIN